jgi:hypothetical protein
MAIGELLGLDGKCVTPLAQPARRRDGSQKQKNHYLSDLAGQRSFTPLLPKTLRLVILRH